MADDVALQEHDIAELGNIENVHRDEEPVNGEEFPAASAEHAAIYLSKLFEVDPSLQVCYFILKIGHFHWFESILLGLGTTTIISVDKRLTSQGKFKPARFVIDK